MADEEILKFLTGTIRSKGGAAEWNLFKVKQRRRIDLSQAELNDAELRSYNFARVDLRAARLFDADLTGVDLSYADLSYADLRRSDLARAFLTNATLVVANLEGTNMVDTNLDHADLRNARLGGAYMVGASLLAANLEGANLRGANLKFANLMGAKVKGANVEDADLTSASFTEEMIAEFKNFSQAIVSAKHLTKGKGKPQQIAVEEDYEELFPEQDCYRIIGVDRKAKFEDIQRAYKKRVKEYHPDLVAHLGEKLKIVARREFERIQLAYRSLSHYRSKPLMSIEGLGVPDLLTKELKDYNIEDFEKLLFRLPNNDRLYYNIGVKYFEIGLVELAIKSYKKALELNPANSHAQHNLKIAQLVQTLKK